MSTRLTQFSAAIENRIIALMVQDPDYLAQIGHLVKHEYFRDDVQRMIRVFMFYYQKKKVALDRHSLAHAAKMDQRAVDQFFEIKTAKLAREYYIHQLVAFARSYELEKKIVETAGQIEAAAQGDETVSFAGLEKDFQKIMSIDVMRDFGDDYFKSAKARIRDVHKYRSGCAPTGFPILDKKLGGGLDVGELGVIYGAAHSGKSQMLINFGHFAVLRGFHVLHLTLEMRKLQVQLRYDCRTAMLPRFELQRRRKTVFSKIRELRMMNDGKLIVQDYVDQRPTVAQVSGMLRAYREHHGNPDLLLIDYADLMMPSGGYGRESKAWEKVSDIYTDLRFLAGEHKVRLWTVSQIKQASFGADIVDIQDGAGTVDKAAIADIIGTICQKRDEKQKGFFRMHLGKNRDGESGDVIRYKYDWSKSYIAEAQDQ